MKYKIFDTSFAHAVNMTWHWRSQKSIEWYRGGDHYDTCFFTDNELSKVDSVNCKTKVAILMEPPVISPGMYSYIKSNYKKFDYILTFCKDLINIDSKRFLYYNTSQSWIPVEDRRLHHKTNLVSIVASSKRETEGHVIRHKIVDLLSKKQPFIDVYGCGYGKFTHPKTPFISPYMYSIAIENSMCDDYFTEKISDCFVLGSIPIYWGTRNIGNYFNEDGIIRFETIEELEYILQTLSYDHYVSKMDAIKENFELANKNITTEDYIFEKYPFLFSK